MRRQRDAFDYLIGLEPDTPEELAFRECVGTPLPYDVDWEKAEQCAADRVKALSPRTR